MRFLFFGLLLILIGCASEKTLETEVFEDISEELLHKLIYDQKKKVLIPDDYLSLSDRIKSRILEKSDWNLSQKERHAISDLINNVRQKESEISSNLKSDNVKVISSSEIVAFPYLGHI